MFTACLSKKKSVVMLWVAFSTLSVVVGAGCSKAFAQSCSDRAQTDLEKVYCDVKAEGEGDTLPSLDEFSKNDEVIQRLLLKRPAERAGVDLPEPKVEVVQTQRVSVPKPLPSRVSGQKNKTSSEQSTAVVTKEPRTKQPQKTASTRVSREKAAAVSTIESACELFGMKIRCGSSFYQLALNQPNHKIDRAVLQEDYRFSLPDFKGSVADTHAVRSYLANAYEQYLQHMLSLGLGGSTMSYSAFYYTFERHQSNNTDFAGRFETMFEFLKKDKKTIGLASTPPDYFPDKLKQCDTLGTQLIVCSDNKLNWVYTLDQS